MVFKSIAQFVMVFPLLTFCYGETAIITPGTPLKEEMPIRN